MERDIPAVGWHYVSSPITKASSTSNIFWNAALYSYSESSHSWVAHNANEQLDVMNGYDATKEIRKLPQGKTLPIIAVTAGIIAGEKEKCLGFGMNDYISKPVQKENLKQTLLKWLNQS